jgi:hypothetical protein
MRRIAITIILSLCCLAVYAQTKRALLIANHDYTKFDLTNPKNDIDTLEKYLRIKGFEVRKAVNWKIADFDSLFSFIDDVDNNEITDTIYIHYSGHGVQVKSSNYLVPVDYDFNDESIFLMNKLFDMSELFKRLDASAQITGNAIGLIGIDACRDNPFQKNEPANLPNEFESLYKSFDIYYSVNPGQQSTDGSYYERISPFTRAMAKGIQNCGNLSDITQLINREYGSINSKPHHSGNNGFSFCSQVETSLANTKIFLQAEYRKLMSEVIDDFDRGNFDNTLRKIIVIRQFLESNAAVCKFTEDEKLQLDRLEGISLYKIGRNDEAIELLAPLAKREMADGRIMIFREVYTYLSELYKVLDYGSELSQLRLLYLNYLKMRGADLDVLITYDKIAGDFEDLNAVDSARFYYQEVIENISKTKSFELRGGNDSLIIAHIYSNIGNCYRRAPADYNKARNYLEEAMEIGRSDIDFVFQLWQDLISMELSVSKVISKKMITNYNRFFTDNIMMKDDLISNFKFNDLLISIYEKEHREEELVRIVEILDSIIFSQNYTSILEDSIQQISGSDCSRMVRNISLKCKQGILPVLFFDTNCNGLYDSSFDYSLMASNADLDKVEFSFSGSNISERWVNTLKTRVAKTNGFFRLKSVRSSDVSISSFCYAVQEGDFTIWSFRLDNSEYSVAGLDLYVGLKHASLMDEYEKLNLDDILTFCPITPNGQKSNRFARSTFYSNDD